MTSQVYGMCFVSVNGNKVFQDNRVKLRVVIFVYVYFINMQKNGIKLFYLRTPFEVTFCPNLVIFGTFFKVNFPENFTDQAKNASKA